MTGYLRIALIVAAFASTASTGARGGEFHRPPHEWFRTLEALQDQISRGVHAAHVQMPNLLAKIAYELGALEPKELLDPLNIRAVIAFTMSGGDGSTLRRILGLGALSPLEDKLAKGALAYSEGKYSEASEHFKDIDARELDGSLAGRVALIQAILAYKRDIKASIAFLNLTRLLATGTLVEEAAIRRQAVLEAAVKDREKFEMLSFQYFRRFGKSVYANYFKKQFAVAAAGLDYGGKSEHFEKIKSIAESMDEDERTDLYVLLAENAILMGNLPLTRFAADKGIDSSKPDTIERVRSELYEASAEVVGVDTEAALKTLEAVPNERLNPIDGDLQRAAVAVGRQIIQPVDEKAVAETAEASDAVHGKSEADKQGENDAPAAEQTPAKEEDATLAKAKSVIAKADQILTQKK